MEAARYIEFASKVEVKVVDYLRENFVADSEWLNVRLEERLDPLMAPDVQVPPEEARDLKNMLLIRGLVGELEFETVDETHRGRMQRDEREVLAGLSELVDERAEAPDERSSKIMLDELRQTLNRLESEVEDIPAVRTVAPRVPFAKASPGDFIPHITVEACFPEKAFADSARVSTHRADLEFRPDVEKEPATAPSSV